MTEAKLASKCIDRVTTYLSKNFSLENWEARPIAADVVIIVLEELKAAKGENADQD